MAIWDGQKDVFTKKFLSLEAVFVTMYFLWVWAHKEDEKKKELKQFIDNTGEKAKQCDFSCITSIFLNKNSISKCF